MITKEYLQQELVKRIDGYKRGVETTTDNIIAEMKSILVLVDALQDRVKDFEKALDNECKRYFNSMTPEQFLNTPNTNIARHFAQWGAEHCGSLGTMVSGWMARDRNGHLNFFLAEPRRFTNVRGEEYWIGHARMKMPNEFLPELSWSNEPIKVKLKVEKYESSKS